MAKEVKINLRLSMRVREVLNDEAEVEDTRIGTVANRLLQEELDRMMAVGADRCVMKDTKEYRALMPHLEGSYVLPNRKSTGTLQRGWMTRTTRRFLCTLQKSRQSSWPDW